MKNTVFFFVAIAFFSLTACASKKHITRQSKTPRMHMEYLLMERTACFGKCPVYAIELFKDGTIAYTGKRFVEDSGKYEKNIGKAAVEKIFQQFMTLRADTCRASYDLLIADLPGINYHYNINGEERKISNATFGPSYLRELAADIDSLGYGSHKGWKKIQ